jgi:MEDS: MEthanogen/methylotroph, DcmR Sensory domain
MATFLAARRHRVMDLQLPTPHLPTPKELQIPNQTPRNANSVLSFRSGILTAMPHEGVRIHQHAVQFYENEASLVTTVGGFLGEGLAAGQPAIMIATPDHREAIVRHLEGRAIDCARACRNGDLILLDAEETLALFMVGDAPNAELFEYNVGGLITRTRAGRPRAVVRAYGEMVDLLWKIRPEAAIKLEILWNTLAMKHDFALLCGYAMGSFYKQSKQLDVISALHSHVVPVVTA